MNQVRQMKMTINSHDSSSWKQQTKTFHWTWMRLHWKRQLIAWQMDDRNNANQWNRAASLSKWKKRHQSKNLLRTTKLMDYIPVKVTPHRTLNSRIFVIKCTELDNIEEHEIKKNSNHKELLLSREYQCVTVYMGWRSKGKTFWKKSTLDTWKKKQDLTFQTPKDASNARNLATQKIHAKESQFVLDVVRKGTM